MEIIIRKALPEDAYNLAVCGISCWEAAYKGIIPDEYLYSRRAEKEQRVESLRNWLTEPGDVIPHCVILENKMIGLLDIHIVDANIWAIYLLEEFWGKGYGKEVLDFAINELKSLGHKKIYLCVLEENKRARRFYEKHGFEFNGEKREREYGKLLVQLEYVLNLT